MYAYRLPNETNKKIFFDELNETLNKTVNKYNIFIAGDLLIDTGDKSKDTNNYICDFMDNVSLNNLLQICFWYYPIIMLMSKMRCFQKTSTVATGNSDRRKMIVTCLKAHFKKLLSKKIAYRNYKNFNKNTFLYDLDQKLIQELNKYCGKSVRKTNRKHQSILEIRENLKLSETFKIPKAKVSNISNLLKNINIKKATGPDTIPPKLVKLSANIADSH